MQQNVYSFLEQALQVLFVLLVDKIDHDLHHHVLLLGLTISYNQRESDKSFICKAFRTVRTIEDAVIIEEPQEERSSNTLVPVAKRVILRDQIKQHGGFLFYAGIEFFTAKGLVYLTNGAFETVVFLITEE